MSTAHFSVVEMFVFHPEATPHGSPEILKHDHHGRETHGQR